MNVPDLDAYMEIYHPDVVLHGYPPELPPGRRERGSSTTWCWRRSRRCGSRSTRRWRRTTACRPGSRCTRSTTAAGARRARCRSPARALAEADLASGRETSRVTDETDQLAKSHLSRGSGAPATPATRRAAPRSIRAERRHRAPRRAARSPRGSSARSAPGLGRPRVEDDEPGLEADSPHRLDRQQRVVDRPEPGRGDDRRPGSPRSRAKSRIR